MTDNAIRFPAAVYKVQTLANDNTIRVTLDLPETEIAVMAQLAACRRDGIYLMVSCTASDTNIDNKRQQSTTY